MKDSRYLLPQKMSGSGGEPRCVGVEIEMSGIELPVIAGELVAAYGGKIEAVSEYEIEVRESSLGDFKIELDFEYLQKLGRRKLEESEEWSREFELMAADALQALTKNLIPCELVTPPIPFERLGELDVVVDRLRSGGANGTRQALFSAFGLHLNPELPDLEAETILSYLRAFICLSGWLEAREGIVLSRKFSLFIRSYPAEYEELVLRENYQPSLSELMDDYLEHNATRNRMLDLLPMFAFLDEERVLAFVGGQKLRKRPTLHYRLPNSDIDQPDWGVWQSWNGWMQVESLANDRDRLREVSEAWRESRAEGYFSKGGHDWNKTVEQWLIDPTSP